MAKRPPTKQEIVREQLARAIAETYPLNAHLDPDEVERIVTEVVEEVRQEMYEEQLRQ